MPDTRSGPLTFGQLSAWRSIENLTPPQRVIANVVRSWSVPPTVSIDDVRRALDAVELRHPSIRSTLDPDALVQIVRPPSPVPLEVVATRPSDDPLGAAYATDYQEEPFDIESERPWRLRLLTDGGRPYTLIVCVNHLAADLWAILRLQFEFGEFVAGRGSGLPEAPAPLDVAAEQRGDGWARRREAAKRYWATALDGIEPVAGGGEVGWVCTATMTSERARDAARVLASRYRVSPHSVVLAAFALVTGDLGTEGAHVPALFASNRSNPRWNAFVSSVDQIVPVRLDRGATDGSFEEVAQRIHRLSLNAYRHGCFDVDDVQEVAAPYRLSTVGPGFRTSFNYAAVPDLSAPAGEPLAETTMTTQAVEGFRSIPLMLLVHGDGSGYTLRISTGQRDEDRPAAVLAEVERVISACVRAEQ